MQSRQLKQISFIISPLLFFCFSCHHSTLDPEAFINNTSDQEVLINWYSEGILLEQKRIEANTKDFFCICKPINLSGDSIVFKLAPGDSIVYHNQLLTNSNFEKTKARSPFLPEVWNEISRNKYQYTILPTDFR